MILTHTNSPPYCRANVALWSDGASFVFTRQGMSLQQDCIPIVFCPIELDRAEAKTCTTIGLTLVSRTSQYFQHNYAQPSIICSVQPFATI